MSVASTCRCFLAQQPVWLTSIQPFTGADWDAGVSMRIGAEIMLEEINRHSALLNGYELKVVWQDGLCSKSTGTNLFMQNLFDMTYEAFAPGVALADLDADGDGVITTADTAPLGATFDGTIVDPAPVGLLGSGCSGTALNIASTAYHARMPMISNSATRPGLSDRSEHPNFFRTILPDTFFNNAWVAMVRMLGLTTFTSVVGETENWGSMGEGLAAAASAQGVSMRGLDLTAEIAGFYGAQVGSDSQAAAKEAASELVRLKERIVVLLMFAARNRLVMCEAHKLGLRNTVYMVFGWFSYGWWEIEDTDCTAAQLTEQATGYISANMMFWRTDSNAVLSCSEAMTSGQFVAEWFARQGADYGDLSMRPEGYAPALEAATTADAACMFAQMLHEVLVVRGVPLEDLAQRTDAAYAEIVSVLSHTDFEGVQGRVRFEPGEADPKGFVILQQMQAGGTICDIASYNHPDMSFFGQCNLVFGYPGESYAAGPAGAQSISAPLASYLSCPSTQTLNMSTNQCEDCPEDQVFLQLFGTCVCQAGFVPSLTALGACEPCNAGKYAMVAGSEVCSECQPGWFSGSSGATECSTCPLGKFIGNYSAPACTSCPEHMTTSAERSLEESYCDCEAGRFRPRGREECDDCPEGMECDFASSEANFATFGGNNMNVPTVLEGYYTEASEPLSVYACRDEEICTGGLPQSCFGEVTGFMCYRCPGDAMVSADSPHGCDECASFSGVLLVLPFFVGVAIVAGTYYIANSGLQVKATVSSTASISVGLALTIMQVFSILADLSIPWPSSSGDYFSSLGVVMLDVGALSLQCSVGTGATINYFLQISTPFVMLILLAICYMSSWIVAGWFNIEVWKYDIVFNTGGHLSQALFIAFAVIFVRPFECYPHPNDESSVYLYPEVLCWSNDHTPLMILAATVFFFFLLPFLILCIWGNYVAPSEMVNDGSTFHRRFRFLLYRFRPDCWWWGNVFLVRQTFLAFSSSLPSGDPHSQIFYTVLTLTVYLAALSRFWPWKNAALNRLDCATCMLLIFVMLTGTAFVERSPAQNAYVFLLSFFIVLKWVMLASMGVLIIKNFWQVGASKEYATSHRGEDFQDLKRALRICAEHIGTLSDNAFDDRLGGMNQFDRDLLMQAVLAWACGGEILTRSSTSFSLCTIESQLLVPSPDTVEEKAKGSRQCEGFVPTVVTGAEEIQRETKPAAPVRVVANPTLSAEGTMLLTKSPQADYPSLTSQDSMCTQAESNSHEVAITSPDVVETVNSVDWEAMEIGEEETSVPIMARPMSKGASQHAPALPAA